MLSQVKPLFVSLLLLVGGCSSALAANSFVYCSRPAILSAVQKDHLLVLSSTIKDLLESSGSDVAIVSRSGIDLDRFNIRYSHTGISLKHSQNTPWSIRQLYYACDEGRSRIFDQGLSGFLLDQDGNKPNFISLVFVKKPAAASLEQATLNNRTAVSLLGTQYSANAYAFSTLYQNCNQWVIELLAAAWGAPMPDPPSRVASQTWLKQQHYQPTDIDVKHRFMVWISHLVPLVHNNDHPAENLEKDIYQVSMPASVENFVRATTPGAERIEVCLNQKQIVIHRGWDLIADNCVPGAEDKVVPVS